MGNIGDYQELDGTPDLCRTPLGYIGVGEVEFWYPYQEADDVAVTRDYLVNASAPAGVFEAFNRLRDNGFEEVGPPSDVQVQDRVHLGWDSEEEEAFLTDMKELAEKAKFHVAYTEKEAREKIHDLAKRAFDTFRDIENRYHHFDNDVVLVGGPHDPEGGVPRAYSLSWDENEVAQQTGRPLSGPDSLWVHQRIQAREELREEWDYAMSMLWCATVGISMQESFMRNKEIWEAEHGPDISQLGGIDDIPGGGGPGNGLSMGAPPPPGPGPDKRPGTSEPPAPPDGGWDMVPGTGTPPAQPPEDESPPGKKKKRDIRGIAAVGLFFLGVAIFGGKK